MIGLFFQVGVTSHYNPVVNLKPLTHYSMWLYKQLPQETGQVSKVLYVVIKYLTIVSAFGRSKIRKIKYFIYRG